MASAIKTPRLLAAAKEFNIGKETLVEYLSDKGFEVNASNPNTKLTEEMYDALQAEFAQDKAAKLKSEGIALPKGSLLDNIKKTKDQLDLTVRDKKEDAPAAVVPVPEKKKEEAPKEPEATKASEVKEEPKIKEEPKVVEAPVEDKKPAVTVAKEEVAEEKPAVEESKAVNAPKLEGPNVLGKINLEEMNLSSRPKKRCSYF